MNTRGSVAYGWGVLILAGAGSYYFAKRSVNSDRAERAEAEERRRQQRERMRLQEQISARARETSSAGTGAGAVTGQANAKRKGGDSLSPSQQPEAGDPAPVTHAQEDMARRGAYEAAEPFRAKKGDRFS